MALKHILSNAMYRTLRSM